MIARGYLIAAATGVVLATAATAQTARTSPDQIVCAMSGVCGSDAGAPGADRQIKVGQEKSFSLVKPSAMMAVTPTAAPSAKGAPPARYVATKAVRRAPPPRPASGRVDMLVTFGLGSADLDSASRQEIQNFATAMSSPNLASMHFNIEGHTDAVGDRAYNLDLSKRRADAVASYLASLGVDPSRIKPQGYGFDKPRAGLAPRAPGNRRVEFVKAS